MYIFLICKFLFWTRFLQYKWRNLKKCCTRHLYIYHNILKSILCDYLIPKHSIGLRKRFLGDLKSKIHHLGKLRREMIIEEFRTKFCFQISCLKIFMVDFLSLSSLSKNYNQKMDQWQCNNFIIRKSRSKF